jgi:hypothetical protein
MGKDMDTKAPGAKPSIEMLEHDIRKTNSLARRESNNSVTCAQHDESIWSALKSNWRALLCGKRGLR